MRIALIGAHGQLGTDLGATLRGEVVPLGHAEIEVTDLESVRTALDRPLDAVVNCAAYNLVDRAEDEPDVAYAVNALGPRNVAIVCAEKYVPLLHIGSDYVFGLDESRTTPYREDDPPGPVSAYGTSKLAGEYFVRSLQPRSFVVRTCGLYGHAATRAKGNFVESMLRLGRERDRLTIVDDQTCTPTSTADLAVALARLIETDTYGTYHGTSAGETTWCGLAKRVLELAGIEVEVAPITTAEFGARARRPAYSVLDSSKLADVTGVVLRPWEEAVAEYLSTRPV